MTPGSIPARGLRARGRVLDLIDAVSFVIYLLSLAWLLAVALVPGVFWGWCWWLFKVGERFGEWAVYLILILPVAFTTTSFLRCVLGGRSK